MAAAAFAGTIRARLAAVGREIFVGKFPSSCSSSLAGACIKGVAGNVSHDQNPFSLKTGRNDPVRGPHVLGNFSRVLEMKMSVLGLGFYLARKTKFI